MPIRRLVLAVAMACALSGASAFAAGLDLSSDTLSAGTTPVARCDPTPGDWAYSFTKNSAGAVTAVTVSGIAAGCAGGALSLGTSPSGATGGPATVTSCTSTCSATVSIAPTALPAQLTSLTVLIVGP